MKTKMSNRTVLELNEKFMNYGNLKETFDYFLDNLLCDFSQNVETV